MNRRLGTVAFFSLLTSTAVARQACPGYWESLNTVPGADGTIHACGLWDPDHAGPLPEMLVLGGNFGRIGSTNARSACLFDGSQFLPLGSNLDPGPLFVWNGDLFAVVHKFGRVLQRWNGFSWQPFGTPFNVYPLASMVFQNEIVVGGWREIRRWNGVEWTTFGDGLDSYVRSLAEYQGQLIAGGDFRYSGTSSVLHVAVWDGTSWQHLGGGANSGITSLTVHNNLLIARGSFSRIGDIDVSGIAAWDGTSWTPFPSPPTDYYTLESVAGNLYAYVWDVAGAGNSLLKYASGGWNVQDAPPKVSQVFWYEGRLVVSGGFSATNFNLFEQTPNGWSPWITGGLNEPIPAIEATPFGLVVANEGRSINSAPASRLAIFDGANWSDFPDANPNGMVTRMAFLQDSLYLWGEFTEIGGEIHHGARWRAGEWFDNPLQSAQDIRPQKDGTVLCTFDSGVLELRDGDVHELPPWPFAYSPPTSVTRIPDGIVLSSTKRPDEASGREFATWKLLGDDWVPFAAPDYEVSWLEEFGGQLFACIVTPSPGYARRVARWTGTNWEPLGGEFDGYLTDLREMRGRLVAFGFFTHVGGHLCTSPAEWTGTTWQTMVPQTNIQQSDWLTVWNDGVAMITDACPTSFGIAKWMFPFGPAINLQPADLNACLGGSLDSTIDACGDGIEFRWFLNGTPLADGTQGTGAVVTGSCTASLHIDQITAAELGSLMCRVSNSHGTLDSDTVSISTCIADFDCTGFGDTDDFDSFVRSFEAGDQQADVDGSGFVDTDDFDFFVHAFEAGCP